LIDKNNPHLVSIAKRVETYIAASSENIFLDPATFLAIINCIIALSRLLYVCYTNSSDPYEAYYNAFRRPGPMMRYLMRSRIRKEFPTMSVADREIVSLALLEVSKGMSVSEINSLMQLVNGE
jgi:hypothetical protein